MSVSTIRRPVIVYPDSDGKPRADNTLQFRWIGTIKEGLERVFHDRPNVFVAGDLLWYPVEGRPDICTAPDALVALSRHPKQNTGRRGARRMHTSSPPFIARLGQPKLVARLHRFE